MMKKHTQAHTQLEFPFDYIQPYAAISGGTGAESKSSVNKSTKSRMNTDPSITGQSQRFRSRGQTKIDTAQR